LHQKVFSTEYALDRPIIGVYNHDTGDKDVCH
jgi:hypothetical protein